VRGAAENEADMMAYMAGPGRVASCKKLRRLRFVDAIPKSVSGKLTTDLGTRIKKICETDKWTIY
jgi:acyl-coenzyme A synthetase/AMP-(fatty) acid ligase